MKGRKHKASGGESMSGVREYDQDLKDRPARYNNSKVENEAEERKRGGSAKKHVGKLHGAAAKAHAGRAARKSGGRAGADSNPFSSARRGTAAKGRSVGSGD